MWRTMVAVAMVSWVMAGSLASRASAQATPTTAPSGDKYTYVVCHGATAGGWEWKRIDTRLRADGHTMYRPTYTGLGERAHLANPDIDLDTHITDIVNVFRWEDLKDVCLVVHSYGGWPGSGALEQIGDRVSAIVWLDAFKPENGQRGLDTASPFSREGVEAAVARGEPGRQAPAAQVFGVNEADRAWVDSKLTPQPSGVLLQPIKLTGAREKIAKKTYIRAPRYPQAAFDKACAECKADKSWRTFETATSGHDVMVDEPEWLRDILLQVA